MENFNWWTIGIYVFIAVLIVIVVGPGFVIGYFISKKFNDQIKEERADLKKHQDSIRNNGGVMAPGMIVSARQVRSWSGGKNRSNNSHILDYEVNVSPVDGIPFRTSFRDELYRSGYTIINKEMISEHGRKIWVIYDPKDMSRAFLDHYDEQHEEVMLNYRRGEFNKLTEGNEELKKTGQQAEAIITRVDDLNLPYPLKGSRAMHMWFDVTPKTGFVFQAEANALITETSLEKYSIGKMVYIRFDPHKPERAVLDTEKNRAIQ